MGCDIHVIAQVLRGNEWQTVDRAIADDRNYDTFAVYADVRNGEDWTPIAAPRGLPSGDYDGDDLGDHSYSWLTLREIQEAWQRYETATHTRSGIVDRETYAGLLRGEHPRSWCGGISGRGVRVVSAAEAATRDDYTHVQASWPVAANSCLRLMWKHIAELTQIQRENEIDSPDHVRIVFGFDS